MSCCMRSHDNPSVVLNDKLFVHVRLIVTPAIFMSYNLGFFSDGALKLGLRDFDLLFDRLLLIGCFDV
jgi:hypothetical protein